MEENKIPYKKIDTSNKESEESLIQIGGKRQVPFLVDTDRNIQMYESSDIIEYAKKVCAQPSLEMVERHGERPGSIYCENVDHEIASITARIRQFEEGENVSLGIIVKTSADAKRLYNALSGEYAVHLLSKDN